LKDRLVFELDHYKEVNFGDLIRPVDKDEKEKSRKWQKARNPEGLISFFKGDASNEERPTRRHHLSWYQSPGLGSVR
jgi:hypothetical protein